MLFTVQDWSTIIFIEESKFDVCVVTIVNVSFTKKKTGSTHRVCLKHRLQWGGTL